MGKNKLILFILILLCGCSSENDIIKFSDDRKIQLGSEFNSCTLVEKVRDKEITKFDYDGNRILVDSEDAVTCPAVDTSKIGKREIRFKFKDKTYTIEVEIIDRYPPQINCKEKEIRLDSNKTETDLLDHIDVIDDDKEIVLTVSGVNYGKAGIYTAYVQAADSSGNISKLQLTVIIEEIKKADENTEKKENNQTIQNKVDTIQQPSVDKPKEIIEEKPVKIKAENRQFLFSEGYDYESSYEAALSYAKNAVSQGLANGYTCEPIKNGKEYIGYIVIFK